MISAISKYMPRWLMAIIATALILATVVGSNQDSAEAIDPADTDTAYIADGTNFADALMGATIASLNNAPMLGVAGTNGGDLIPGETSRELDRLTDNKTNKLDTIYVFGGSSAVSDTVVSQLAAWANDVQRIAGTSRWGTYEEISKMLPAKAKDADLLDGMDSTEFLGATAKAADSELLDGLDAGAFWQKAEDVDAATLGGQPASAYAERVFALVEADGSLVDGANAVSASRSGLGSYLVTFDRDVTGCAIVAMIGSVETGTGVHSPGGIRGGPSVGGPEEVFVRVTDPSGAAMDGAFHIAILC